MKTNRISILRTDTHPSWYRISWRLYGSASDSEFSFSLSRKSLLAHEWAVFRVKSKLLIHKLAVFWENQNNYIRLSCQLVKSCPHLNWQCLSTEKLPIYIWAVFHRSSWSWILNLKLRLIKHTRISLTKESFGQKQRLTSLIYLEWQIKTLLTNNQIFPDTFHGIEFHLWMDC